MPSRPRSLAALVLASVSLSCSGGNTASQLANAPASGPTAVPLAEAETLTCPGVPSVEARAPTADEGALNMNTIPPSTVSLDGTSLGCTPKFGFPVSPGAHVVMFIAPDGQKKVLSVTVRAGETKVVAAKLGP